MHQDREPPPEHDTARLPEMARQGLKLLEELGEGSTGTVYRARLLRPLRELEVGAEVAVKVLHPGRSDDPAARHQLITEGRLGRQIHSEHVVRILDFRSGEIAADDQTFLIMELIHGRTLRSVLDESGSVVEELTRRIGLYGARGLQAVHRLGLVHRDIKPENLALTDTGTVKLMDLGLARKTRQRRDGVTGSGFFGSLSYAAPEVLRGEPATPRSDLYSLGVVMFEVATGRHPFATAKTDADQVIQAHLRDTPARPSHFKPRISAFLEQLILDLLAKRPGDRPSDAAELATTLQRGENSRYWLRHERAAPRLAGRRRLRDMRRVADAPFFGRREELRQLDRHLRHANDGRGRAVFVSGPRNMGRRRLLDHWLEGALDRRADLAFLGGEARGGEGLGRAAPFAEMILEWFLRGDLPHSPQAQSRLAARMSAQTSLTQAEIERLAAVVCGSDDITSAEERADLVARLLLAMRPADQTLVLRIDLAEQLSTTANLVVRQLIDSLTNQRVLLILVSLDGRLPPAGAVTLPIAGLLEDEFLALGRQLFADGRVDRDLLRDAHATLAGSPGNLLEALAVLERQGRLAGPIGKYHMLMPVRHLRPAHTLLERLRERLAGLTEPQRFVHTAAAVLGNSFPLADLSQLVGQSELLVLETLSIFQGRIIVTHRGNGRFRHRDFRKVMLEMVSPTVLSRLHRTAAWTLEDRGAAPLEIGLHLSRAGEHDAALQPLLSGLAKLTATGSRQQSQKIRNRLRSHFAELPDTPLYQHLRLHYLALSGQTEELADREERARVDFSAAQELAEQLGAEQALAEAHLALGRLDLGQGQMHTALTHLEAAEQQIPDDQAEPHLLAEIYGTRARVHGYLGQSNAARHYIQAALDLFVDTSDDLLAHLHTDLARIEALRNDFSAALDSLARAEAMFSGRGSSSGLLRIELHRGHILAMLGSRDQATQRLEAAAVRASELSNLRAQAKARLFLGEQALLHRDHTAARPHLEFARSNSPRDTNTRVAAEIYLAECGWQFADLPGEVATLGVPELTVAWILMTTAANPDPELLQRARQIEREVSIPLHLHRQLLYRTGRAASARRLEKRIAESLPRGPLRRRFQVLVKQAPATPDH